MKTERTEDLTVTFTVTAADADYLMRTLASRFAQMVERARTVDIYMEVAKPGALSISPGPGAITAAYTYRAEQLHRLYMTVGKALCAAHGLEFVPADWSYDRRDRKEHDGRLAL